MGHIENAVCHVKEGHPAQMILDTIREHKIDLVVLGARRQNGFRQFVLGSTSKSIVTQARCSVLVVRQHDIP